MRLSAVRMACRISRVNPSNTALLVCDIQDKFSKQIQFFPEIVVTSKRLIDAARILGMKTVATEQYPKGLGHLVPELGIEPNGDIPVFDKSKFSMCIEPVLPHLKDTKNVILCGIEAHVCVLQTTLDLLERGFEVHVVADAVSSRTQENRKFAFKQMERAGAVLTTSECVILGLVGGADHPKFKEFSMCIEPVLPHLKDTKNVILCGIEAHVCVLQTTLDLLERGFEVHVVADAVSSRTQENRKFAFKQMERAGAVLTTSECVILGLVGGADHPKFKEVQKLIMQSAPDTGLCKL